VTSGSTIATDRTAPGNGASGSGNGAANNQGGTQAVDRAAALLTHVVEADAPVTFAELSEASGLARSTTSRLLAALERTRLLERSGTGEYIGGPLFVLYAARHDRNKQLARLALPVLEAIGEITGETVHVAVANGGRVEHLAQVDSTYLLGARDWTDVEVPAHCSALGKVLLAWDVLERPAGRLEAPTGLSLRSRAELDADLAQVRDRGFAVTRDELEVGLAGVAAPVFAPVIGADLSAAGTQVVATVGISGPTARLEDRLDQIGRLLIDQTETLSALLRHGNHPQNSGNGPERGTA
jgi:IclR family acetate operon transcriptional repressor